MTSFSWKFNRVFKKYFNTHASWKWGGLFMISGGPDEDIVFRTFSPFAGRLLLRINVCMKMYSIVSSLILCISACIKRSVRLFIRPFGLMDHVCSHYPWMHFLIIVCVNDRKKCRAELKHNVYGTENWRGQIQVTLLVADWLDFLRFACGEPKAKDEC